MIAIKLITLRVVTMVLFGVTCAIAAQEEFSGKIIDSTSQRPIFGALIEFIIDEERKYSVTSNDLGVFKIPVGTGTSKIVVTMIGYHQKVVLFDVATFNSESEKIIKLNASPIELTPIQIIGESDTVNRQRVGTATKISAKTVKMIKPIGTQELLSLVPGVNAYADDGFGNSRLSIGIRGINPRRSSRVLILEDGIPIQPAIYVYPNAYYNPPAERIDEVEVIKSSGAVRYGPQTMGGVINYKTTRPGDRRGWLTQITGGNNSYMSLNAQRLGLGYGKFTTDIQALYKRGDGFRQNNGFEQYNTTLKTQYILSEKKFLYLKVNGNFEDSNATYTGLTEYSFETQPNFNPKPFDRFKVKRASVDLIYTARITDTVIENTSIYLNVFDRRWWREDDIFTRASTWNRGDNTAVPYYQSGDIVRVGGGQNSFGILRTFYVGGIARDYQFTHSMLGNSANAEVGVRGHWERFIDDKKIGSTPNARSGIYYKGTIDDPDNPVAIVGQSHHYETSAFSLYAQDKIKFGKLSVDTGLRLETFRQSRVDRLRGSIFADKVSVVLLPGLGLNYSIGNNNLFGSIHRGYTPPSSGTLKVTNFGANVPDGGLDLKSEKSWNIEAGARTKRKILAIELTGFLVKIKDLVAAGRGTAFKNLGSVDTWGMELGSKYSLSSINSFLPDLNVSYTFLQTEIKRGLITSSQKAGGVTVNIAGNQLPYAPEHTVTVGFEKSTESGFNLRTDLNFVDQVYTDFENVEVTSNRGDMGPVPCFTVINASLDYPVVDSWHLFVSAKNITDKIYIGSRLHSNPGQPQANLSSGILIGPRRQINFGLRRSL
ncbi:MAG: TonB-dependent receptor [Candidatus Latescibacterota bacterium]|nr:TonB-dependent receptor [Candidatus Latescibacterota bacterium]